MKVILLLLLLSILIISGCTQNTQPTKEIVDEYYEKVCKTQLPYGWSIDPQNPNRAYYNDAHISIFADQYLGNSLASESYRWAQEHNANFDYEEKISVGEKEIHEIRYSYQDSKNRTVRASHVFFRNQDTQCSLWLVSFENTSPSYLKDLNLFIAGLQTPQSQPFGQSRFITDDGQVKQFNPDIVFINPGYSITRSNSKSKPDIITPSIENDEKYELKIEYKNPPEGQPMRFTYSRTGSYNPPNFTAEGNSISMVIENYTKLSPFKTEESFKLFSIVMDNHEGEYTVSLMPFSEEDESKQEEVGGEIELKSEFNGRTCTAKLPDTWKLLDPDYAKSEYGNVNLIAGSNILFSLPSISYIYLTSQGIISADDEDYSFSGGNELHKIVYPYIEEGTKMKGIVFYFKQDDTICSLRFDIVKENFNQYSDIIEKAASSLEAKNTLPLGEIPISTSKGLIENYNPDIVYLNSGDVITRTNNQYSPDIIIVNSDGGESLLKIDYNTLPLTGPLIIVHADLSINNYPPDFLIDNQAHVLQIYDFKELFPFKTKYPFQPYIIILNNYDGEYTASLEPAE